MKAKNVLKEVENEILKEKKEVLKAVVKEKLEEIRLAKKELKKAEKDLKEFLELDIDDVEIQEESDYGYGIYDWPYQGTRDIDLGRKPERYKTWVRTTTSSGSGTTIMYGGT